MSKERGHLKKPVHERAIAQHLDRQNIARAITKEKEKILNGVQIKPHPLGPQFATFRSPKKTRESYFAAYNTKRRNENVSPSPFRVERKAVRESVQVKVARVATK